MTQQLQLLGIVSRIINMQHVPQTRAHHNSIRAHTLPCPTPPKVHCNTLTQLYRFLIIHCLDMHEHISALYALAMHHDRRLGTHQLLSNTVRLVM